MTLHLVEALPEHQNADAEEALTYCKDCGSGIRPAGSTEDQFPGTARHWGNHQCQACDYLAAGKDPDDTVISAKRISYLTSLREGIEIGRRRLGVPASGSRAGRIPLPEFLKQVS